MPQFSLGAAALLPVLQRRDVSLRLSRMVVFLINTTTGGGNDK
jgi:hypothetical protein